jgi:hypothetical protein
MPKTPCSKINFIRPSIDHLDQFGRRDGLDDQGIVSENNHMKKLKDLINCAENGLEPDFTPMLQKPEGSAL